MAAQKFRASQSTHMVASGKLKNPLQPSPALSSVFDAGMQPLRGGGAAERNRAPSQARELLLLANQQAHTALIPAATRVPLTLRLM